MGNSPLNNFQRLIPSKDSEFFTPVVKKNLKEVPKFKTPINKATPDERKLSKI